MRFRRRRRRAHGARYGRLVARLYWNQVLRPWGRQRVCCVVPCL